MAMIIDGKTIAAGIREEVRVEVDRLKREKGITPALAVILVGDNPASRVYVKNKGKASSEAGIRSIEHILPQDAKEKEILSLISRLNNDPSVHGILVQLPLPAHHKTV